MDTLFQPDLSTKQQTPNRRRCGRHWLSNSSPLTILEWMLKANALSFPSETLLMNTMHRWRPSNFWRTNVEYNPFDWTDANWNADRPAIPWWHSSMLSDIWWKGLQSMAVHVTWWYRTISNEDKETLLKIPRRVTLDTESKVFWSKEDGMPFNFTRALIVCSYFWTAIDYLAGICCSGRVYLPTDYWFGVNDISVICCKKNLKFYIFHDNKFRVNRIVFLWTGMWRERIVYTPGSRTSGAVVSIPSEVSLQTGERRSFWFQSAQSFCLKPRRAIQGHIAG